MFPFQSKAAWWRGGRVAHTAAIADLAAPLLHGTERSLLVERAQAYARWAVTSSILLAFLLVGTITTAATSIVAALGLGPIAGPLAAAAGSLAGIVSIAYALVNRHVNGLEADVWGVMTLAALRRSPEGQPSSDRPKSPKP